MSKEVLITLAGVFVLVIVANVIHTKWIAPAMA